MSGDVLISQLESELDETVFDSYGLGQAERDLVKDMCEIGIPFFYDTAKSLGTRTVDLGLMSARCGLANDLASDSGNRSDISGYLETFLRIWNRELEPDGEFFWQIIAPGNPAPMLAVVFTTLAKGTEPECETRKDEQAWEDLLNQLAEDLRVPFYSKSIYVDGLVREASPTRIILIKRNEGRLWTRSAAREDAEATLLKAMHLGGVNGESV
jgi:hypothetical protein